MTNDRDERIRRRAHEIWEEEGRPEGRHDDHWARATREVDGDSEAGQMASMAGASSDPSETTAKGRKRRVTSSTGDQAPAKPRRSRGAVAGADAGEGEQGDTSPRGRRSGPREVTSEGTKPDGAPPSGRRRSAKAAAAEGGAGLQASTGGRRRKAAPDQGAAEGGSGDAAPKRGRRSAKSPASDQ